MSETLMPCLFSIDGGDLQSDSFHSTNCCCLSTSHVQKFTQVKKKKKASKVHDREISLGSGLKTVPTKQKEKRKKL